MKKKILFVLAVIILMVAEGFIILAAENSSFLHPNDVAPPLVMVNGQLYWARHDKIADPPEESEIAGRITNYIPQNRAPETNDTSNIICCVNQPYAFVDGDLIVYSVNVHLSGALPEHTVDAWFYCEPYKW